MNLIDEPHQQASYVLIQAIESDAIAYWAEYRNIKRGKDGNIKAFEVREAEASHGKPGVWRWMTPPRVLEGRQCLLNDVQVSRDIAAQFIGREWETDKNGADCVIQAALFIEIRYS
jgi:hypothetical protein